MSYKCYEVGRESRENHKGQQKAVLYWIHDGIKEKVNVWKPGYKDPKVPLAGIPDISPQTWKEFEQTKEDIRIEEEALGLNDW